MELKVLPQGDDGRGKDDLREAGTEGNPSSDSSSLKTDSSFPVNRFSATLFKFETIKSKSRQNL